MMITKYFFSNLGLPIQNWNILALQCFVGTLVSKLDTSLASFSFGKGKAVSKNEA